MLVNFLNMLGGAAFDLIGKLFSILPAMPDSLSNVQQYMNDSLVGKVLAWVNWFLPLDVAGGIVAVWAAGMMAYVTFQVVSKYAGKVS